MLSFQHLLQNMKNSNNQLINTGLSLNNNHFQNLIVLGYLRDVLYEANQVTYEIHVIGRNLYDYLIATMLDYEIWQMDIKTTFLNGHLEENIYIQRPYGFIQKGQEHMVCNLQRSIYGLKQASRSWNIRFDQAIKSLGFIQNIVNHVCTRKFRENLQPSQFFVQTIFS